MLRIAVIVLLLANGLYFAWAQGVLAAWGLGPQEQSESYRLNQQVRPETLHILRAQPAPALAPGVTARPDTGAGATPGAAPGTSPSFAPSTSPDTPPGAASGEAAPGTPQAELASPAECLEAGVFDERQAEALRAAAAALPAGSWQLEVTRIPGRFMIYMGRFADAEALDRKRAELRALKIPFDRTGNPALEPGLSLGRFASEDAAQRELGVLASQGVRTARVVRERPDAPGFVLRLPAVTEGLRAQLDALRPAMAGRTLRACA